jgi:superkiller protein 3
LELNTHPSIISHWRIRGQTAFQPSTDHALALKQITDSNENRAAYLAALRYSREKEQSRQYALEQYENLSTQPKVKSQTLMFLWLEIAFALAKNNPRLASNAVKAAFSASIHQMIPSQPIIYAAQTLVAEQIGDLDLASLALEKALRYWGNETRWHLWAAEIIASQESPEYGSIIQHLSQSVAIEPKYGLHHLKLGEAYLKVGDPHAAIPVLEEATRLLSQKSSSWLALAKAYQDAGHINQTFYNAERAVEVDPENIEPYLFLAELALDIENPEKSIQFCQSALKLDKTHPQALILKSRALDKINKPSEALQAMNQALERSSKSIPIMLEHAQLTRRAEGAQAAFKALQALVKDHPEDARIQVALADALVGTNQCQAAIQAAQKALHLNQGMLGDQQETNLQIKLGRLMRRCGQLDQAVHYLSQVIQQTPDSVDSYLELGRVYQDRRQYSTALDAYQQAIALEPGNARAYFQAGQILKEIKDYAAAQEMLQYAARFDPDNHAIRRQLAGLVALNLVHNPKEKAVSYVE